ncbi:MAG: hypothetical protein WAU36_10265 [Cyclobacteriaceae bacterium]
MKLSKTQYQDIIHVLDELKISQEKLSLVKIKGRIRISVTEQDSYFEFFRRKSISITKDQHQWKESEHYELTVSGKLHKVPAWPDVLKAFKAWIKNENLASQN